MGNCLSWLYLTQEHQVSEEQWAVGEPESQLSSVPEEILQGQSAVSQYWVLAEVQNLPSSGLSFLICKMACFL